MFFRKDTSRRHGATSINISLHGINCVSSKVACRLPMRLQENEVRAVKHMLDLSLCARKNEANGEVERVMAESDRR